MRYIRFRIVPEERALHPVDGILAENPNVRREAVHNVNQIGEETATILYELDGRISENDELFESLEAHPDILSFDVTSDGENIHAYAHFRANRIVTTLLQTGNELIVEFPLEYTNRGALRITAIGDMEAFERMNPEIPDGIRISIEGTGDYVPRDDRFWSQLTPRQREIVKLAVEMGYYRNPREATYGDIADVLDISDGTVCEHLQKVEEKLFTVAVPNDVEGKPMTRRYHRTD